jgi:hypothetical protein
MKICWKAKTLCSLRSVHFLDETTFQNGRKMSKDVERSELFASPWVVRINSPGAAGNLGGVYPATRIYPDLPGSTRHLCGFVWLQNPVTPCYTDEFHNVLKSSENVRNSTHSVVQYDPISNSLLPRCKTGASPSRQSSRKRSSGCSLEGLQPILLPRQKAHSITQHRNSMK